MNNPTGLEAQESLPALVAFNEGFEHGYKFPSKILVLALVAVAPGFEGRLCSISYSLLS